MVAKKVDRDPVSRTIMFISSNPAYPPRNCRPSRFLLLSRRLLGAIILKAKKGSA
jgi:hypothetical protein